MAHIERYCYWPRMYETIVKYIKGCVMCSTIKPSNRKFGLYMPLPVPLRPWDNISMEFVGGLPMYRRGHDYIYVVVDHFSKMCILVPCKKKVTIEQTTQMFFQQVWVHFRLPTSIISDRDTHFLGEFWSTLWGLMDTKLKKSISFHPQTDEQTKVVNRTVIHILWGYCNKHSKLWDESLPYVHHSYNRAFHSLTNQSPFETCFGYLLKSPMDFMFGEEDKVNGHNDSNKAVISFNGYTIYMN